MNDAFRERFLDAAHAFDHPVVGAVVLGLAVVFVLVPPVIGALARFGRIGAELHAELRLRYLSWLVLAPAILLPILLGPGWTILAIGGLSLFCWREFVRATGLFREKIISATVVLGILCTTFAALDHWYRLFAALPPFTMIAIATAAILRDRPQGYVQRTALGAFGFLLFGTCLGHLGYLANDRLYRPILIWVFVCVESNDVFAYLTGKTWGRRKLLPHTSPNKTVAGAVGALILTTLAAVGIGRFVFAGTPLADVRHLTALGMFISVMGQFGDLMLSSVKRDISIKDMAATIPGHGGLLDRFDSLILVAPVVFHYLNYVRGVGADRLPHVLTGG